MVRRLSLLSYLVAGVAVLPLTAFAAPVGVSARANAMDDYTRIVLDFDKTPSYIADQKSSSLTLTFQAESNLSSAAKNISSAPRVKSVNASDGKHIQFTFSDPKEIRHFTIGNRVIIDVYGAKTVATAKPPAEEPKPEIKKEPEPEPAKAKTETKPEITTEPKADAKSETPAKTPIEKTATAAEETKITEKGAALLPIESTKDIKIATYQSGGLLNIVIDQPNFSPAPIIGGDESIVSKMGGVETHNAPNATIYSVKIPAGVTARTEGGGQKWRVILSAKADSDTSPTPLTRQGSQLLWNVTNTGAPLAITDPASGDDVKIIPVSTSNQFVGPAQNFIDLKILPSQAGLALVPKRDDVKIVTKPDQVVIGDGQTLSISSNIKPSADAAPAPKNSEPKTDEDPAKPKTEAELTGDDVIAPEDTVKPEEIVDTTRYFEFAKWQQGGAGKLDSNRKQIEKGFLKKNVAEQADTLISLAKLEIANGMGAEAKGFLDYAISLVPELETTPTVSALYGASEALIGHDDEAFKRFSVDKLAKNAEIQMWRAASLARLEDWAQAEANLPAYPAMIETYPATIQIPMGLTLAEIFLRNGNPKDADRLMEVISKHEAAMSVADEAALAYLRGESDRQKGKVEDAKKFWQPLAAGHDDLYRVKAGLSLTNLELDRKGITPDEAVDRLEGFRYTWRGDELETAVNFRLGRLYIEKGDPIKGLSTLRQAASLSAPQSDQSTQITELMKKTFKDLFLTNKLDEVSPVDAVTIYEEFAELTPPDEEGSQILERLSSRLADVDLLPRAAAMLQKKIDQGATGINGAETATRLADIMVTDRNPEKALEALNKADEFLKDIPVDQAAKTKKQIALLRADAYSLQQKPDQAYEALSLLAQDEDVLRRRADIAWQNGRWQDSADAIEALVQKSDISPTRPATEEQGELLLSWAIALHKADNRFVLADIRDRFSTAMAASPYNEKFEIITRTKQNAVVVDRASIDKIIGEVDMFKKAGETIAKTEPAAAPSPDAPQPATDAAAATPPSEPVTETPVAEVPTAPAPTAEPAAEPTAESPAEPATTPAEQSADDKATN